MAKEARNVNKSQFYEVVADAVNKMDYMALLYSGAPEDEFEFEIEKISNNLGVGSTILEIAELLATVFNEAFHAEDSADMFLECATAIKRGMEC